MKRIQIGKVPEHLDFPKKNMKYTDLEFRKFSRPIEKRFNFLNDESFCDNELIVKYLGQLKRLGQFEEIF